MNQELYKIANKIMSGHRGILASDERPESANKNLIKAGIEPTDKLRKDYRELFICTPGLEKYINGIILHEETFYQKDSSGKPFKETLLEKGIEIVIKVDGGTEELPESPNEVYTKGLSTLDTELKKFYEDGARLAKWRSVIRIGEGLPTEECLERNSKDLAVYAKACQENSIVPIVEPEVLLNGTHTIEKAEEITKLTLERVFEALVEENVDLEAVILKTSMVVPGNGSGQKYTPSEIAGYTVRTLLDSVPETIPGIVFLSGGQPPEEATENFNAIAGKEPLPWELTFSFLRAVEGPPGKIWGGKSENIFAAREDFINRLKMNTRADEGKLS
ncbi:class I fructose-bisphosphate aldolase [Patescibacteria group bacterium]